MRISLSGRRMINVRGNKTISYMDIEENRGMFGVCFKSLSGRRDYHKRFKCVTRNIIKDVNKMA